jgi:hypothetical protein
VAYFPLIAFQAYLLVTVLMFAFGPWSWPVPNPQLLYGFLAISHVSLGLGYFTAVRHRWRCAPISTPGTWKPERFIRLSAIAVLIMFLPTLWVRTGGEMNVSLGFTDPGAAYNITRAAVSQITGAHGYVEYIRLVLSPLLWPIYPLTIVFWHRLTTPIRIIAVAAVIGDAVTYIAIGTNKGLADVTLLAPWLLLLRSRTPGKLLSFRRVVATGLVLLVLGTVFLSYFGRSVEGRSGGTHYEAIDLGAGIALPPASSDGLDGIRVAAGSWIGANTWNSISAYVTQGYYGLALSLEEPFVWTYGVGNSRILTWIVEKLLGLNINIIYNRTYAVRAAVDFGWQSEVHWHSIYPWLASDVSFWAVPVVVFIIGYLFGLSWLDSLAGNPYAVVFFSLLLIVLYYFSANNQIAQASDTVFVFWISLAAWLRSRRRRHQRSFMPRRRSFTGPRARG